MGIIEQHVELITDQLLIHDVQQLLQLLLLQVLLEDEPVHHDEVDDIVEMDLFVEVKHVKHILG
jgi:hypothetical protein